jgi:hypothetical protein
MNSERGARPLAGWLLATGLSMAALAGCGRGSTPEDEVRAYVAAAEAAAEARSASALFDLVAADYRDERGNGAAEIKRYIRGFLIANQSIHLLTRIDEIEIVGEGVARVRVTVGMLGREASAGESAWDLAASVYEFDLTLVQDDGDWRVTHADWQRTFGR